MNVTQPGAEKDVETSYFKIPLCMSKTEVKHYDVNKRDNESAMPGTIVRLFNWH